jgi:hypothetical protein
MARKLTTASVASQQKTINPFSQPCFTTYALDNGGGGGYYQYDHNFNIVAADHGDGGGGGYGSFRSYSTTASEFFEDSGSYTSTVTNTSTSSNAGWYVAHTCMVGYLGHMSHSSPGSGAGNMGGWNMSGRDNGTSYRAYGFRDVCPIVNESHQDYAIFSSVSGGTAPQLVFTTRSATDYYSRMFNGQYTQKTTLPRNYTNRAGSAENFESTHGGCCYNKKTNKFLVMYTTSNGRFKPVVYNNVPDLREFSHNNSKIYNESMSGQSEGNSNSSFHEYFNNSANITEYQQIDTNTAYNNYSSTNESRYRPIPFLCDNGDIVVFVQTPSSGAQWYRWKGSDQQHDQRQTDGTLSQNGHHHHNYTHTTSYGYEQGRQYGARWQVSSDGKFAWAWCSSYYYGSGAFVMMIRISDGKLLRYQSNDSGDGRQCFPLGVNSMGWVKTANGDGGAGLRIGAIDIKYEMDSRAYGDNVSLDACLATHTFECGYYSTTYPCCIPAKYDTSLFCSTPHMPNISEL